MNLAELLTVLIDEVVCDIYSANKDVFVKAGLVEYQAKILILFCFEKNFDYTGGGSPPYK